MLEKIIQKLREVYEDTALSLIIIASAIVVSHLNIFGSTFVLDDFDFIVDWPLIQSWKNFPNFFINYVPPAGQEGVYSPLKTVFHALFYHLFGLNPLGYHLVSLLIHFAGAALVYQLINRLSQDRGIAFWGSLLFALHPVQVEAITYMTASVDMIGILFLFASFLCFISALAVPSAVNKKQYVASLILSMLAVFTHELAISIPLLFAWYCFCLKRELKLKEVAKVCLPFFAIVGIYVLCKWQVLGAITRGRYVSGSSYLTFLIMVKAWAKYIFIVFWPGALTHNHLISGGISSFAPDDFDKYAVMSQSIFDLPTITAAAVLAAAAFAAWVCRDRKPLITFGIGWFFLALTPVSNIIPSAVFFGERYLYPGLLGFGLIMALIIKHFLDDKRHAKTVIVILAAAIIAYTLRTLARNYDWRSEVSIMESAVKANPKSALMHNDLGLVYTKYGRLDEALKSFDEALKIRKDDPVTYFSQAEAYLQLEQYPKAIESLRQAIRYNSEYAEAYYNLAGIYAVWGMKPEALDNLARSLELYRRQKRDKEAAQMEAAFKKYFSSLFNPENPE